MKPLQILFLILFLPIIIPVVVVTTLVKVVYETATKVWEVL